MFISVNEFHGIHILLLLGSFKIPDVLYSVLSYQIR